MDIIMNLKCQNGSYDEMCTTPVNTDEVRAAEQLKLGGGAAGERSKDVN